MNMPMIRNRNGAGSDLPAPRMHNTSRGAAISANPEAAVSAADRDRRLLERVHGGSSSESGWGRERGGHPVLIESRVADPPP